MPSVVVLGYGVEGKSAAAYFSGLGNAVTVADTNLEALVPEGFEAKLGPDYLEGLDKYDIVVRTPSIRSELIKTTGAVTSVTNEFMALCPAPIIGVTGTKGKGTTSTLIARILETAGKTVWLGGNIGTSPLDFLPQVKPDHVVVLELSSFQLMDAHVSPHIAVCLMLSPDHLDWHTDMDEYIAAKGAIFAHQKPGDLAVYYGADKRSTALAQLSSGRRVPYGQAPGAHVAGGNIVIGETIVLPAADIGLVGPHNLQNVCAAITATWDIIGRDADVAGRAVAGFTGLEHRLELVGEIEGVRYFDDSFATTPETAMAAIRSFEGPKVIILGGSTKGVAYHALARVVEDEGVIHAFLIGDTAPEIEGALREVGFDHITAGYDSMERLVHNCYAVTEPGDVVLLSPACASFGLFANYKDRGDKFKAAVLALSEASHGAN